MSHTTDRREFLEQLGLSAAVLAGYSATARGSTLHLQPTPGTDLALANGLLHIAIRDGYVDEPYVASRTTSASATSVTGTGRPRSSPNARFCAAAADDMQNRPL